MGKINNWHRFIFIIAQLVVSVIGANINGSNAVMKTKKFTNVLL